jgi:lambda family phage minor tail protein L
MAITFDVQKLEAGQRIRLVEVDMTDFGGEILRFHGYNLDFTQDELIAAQTAGTTLSPKTITWQGNIYTAWPYQVSGIAMDGTGTTTSPTLSVANLDQSISALCSAYQDLSQAKVTFHITFQHYLDGEVDADPEQEFIQTWYIDYKTSDNNKSVTWSLSNPAAIGGKMIPARQIQPMCYWMMQGQYRGTDCGYTGTNYFDADGNVVTDPDLDVCGGLVTSCKLRFGATNPLSHGGFISSSDLS